jgi:hypothetical protein
MPEEYDFSTGVRGKYAKRYAEGTNVALPSPGPDVFPDAGSVREALDPGADCLRDQDNDDKISDEGEANSK